MQSPKHLIFGILSMILLLVSQHEGVMGQAFTFYHYGLGEGLTSSNCGALCKDHYGFVWLGTSNGLKRFDGYQFDTYVFVSGDPFSLPNNTIVDVYEDTKHRMWIATRGGGLAHYDPAMERFHTQTFDQQDSLSIGSNYLNQILEDHQGRLWIATDTELNELVSWDDQTKQGRFKQHAALEKTNITTLAEWPKGTLWLGTARGGLIRYVPETGVSQHFPYQKVNGQVVGPISNLIKGLYVDTLGHHDALWACTFRGLTRITVDSTGGYIFTHIRSNKAHPDRFKDNHTICMVRDQDHSLWVGTYNGGVTRLLFEGDSIRSHHFLPQDKEEWGVGNSFLCELMLDEAGILWISHGKGADKVYVRHTEQNQSAFQHKLLPINSKGIATLQDVLCFYQDTADRLLIGTYGEGLLLRTPNRDYFYNEGARTPTRISHAIVTAIDRDRAGTYWVGTYGGFNQLSLQWKDTVPQAQFVNYRHDPGDATSLSNNHIFALKADGDQGYWIGTRGGGLNYFDKKTETFRAFTHQAGDATSISNDFVWSIAADSQGYLWLATDGGVNRFDPRAKTFLAFQYDPERPEGLNDNFINSVYVDYQQRLWVGTNGGGITVMSTIDPGKVLWQIQAIDGLVHDEIYGILEDNEGIVWVTTSNGISRIDPHDLTVGEPIPFDAIQNFYKTDGLQENEFTSGAYWKTEDGHIYVGGINGYNYFLPEEIKRNEQAPAVYLTHLSILNRQVKPGEKLASGEVPLDQSLLADGKLRLTHKDLVVSFSFTALNHLFPEDNQFAYQLVGFDEEWQYVNHERRATYTNLSPGSYTFRVKASNNDGVWNEVGDKVQIRVIPPPWRSWWAYTLYGLMAAGLMYLYIRFRIAQRTRALEVQNRIEKAKAEEREQVRRHAAADYHDELGNKMTKIGLFVELARRNAQNGPQLRQLLDQIETNAQRLSEGMRDFIWVLDPQKDTVFDLVERLHDFAEQMLTYTEVEFSIDGLSEPIGQLHLPLHARRHIIMILKEALNNTLKYAEADHIRLVLSHQAETLEICLQDNGQGFDPTLQKGGYGLDNMRLRAEQIQAAFTLQSAPGAGTEIKLTVPLKHAPDLD